MEVGPPSYLFYPFSLSHAKSLWLDSFTGFEQYLPERNASWIRGEKVRVVLKRRVRKVEEVPCESWVTKRVD